MAVQFKTQPESFHLPGLHDYKVATEKTYTLVRLGARDKGAVTDFLRKFFFRDEPLNIAIGIDQEKACPTLEEYATGPVVEGLSVGAVSPSGRLVGLCINMACTRTDDAENRSYWASVADQLPQDASKPRDAEEKFAQIKRLLERVSAESDVFAALPTLDKLFDINILSVDDEWRGMGIAKKLLHKSREVAQAEGFHLVRCICTSHFSALAVARLGFHCVHSLSYDAILDAQGKPVFRPTEPHREVATYIIQI